MRTLPLLLALLLGSPLGAQVPTTLNYQGRLLQNTAEQDAATGTVDIDFSIWTEPTGGSEVWSESWAAVPLSHGIFSVVLGSNGSPLDASIFQADTSLYLELVVDGETLSPRQMLGAAPFAMVDDPRNELQDLELTGDTLSLSDDATSVDLSKYLDDTDDQDLSLAGDTLVLENDATGVDLSGYLDNTDSQTLSLFLDTLTISGSDSSVDLSSLLDGLASTVFVTSATYKGQNIGGVTAADAICQSHADAAGLDGTFLAWLSDSTSSPATRFDRLGAYYRVDGVRIADDWDDLTDGGLDARFSLDENGEEVSDFVWTGTKVDGTAGAHCDDWTDGDKSATVGRTTTPSSDWSSQITVRCTQSFAIYCIEQALSGLDDQKLSLDGNILQLTSPDGTDEVDLSPYLTDSDNQTLSLSGSNLQLTSDDGTDTVDLSPYLDDTDAQTLSLAGDTLTISGSGSMVDLGLLDVIADLKSQIDALESRTPRTIFVTSATYGADLGGLAGADAECQALADAEGLGGTFLAWLSDSTDSPSTRFVQGSRPIELVNGDRVARGWDDLTDGTLQYPIDRDESGTFRLLEGVWTYTTTAGGIPSDPGHGSCADWTSTSPSLTTVQGETGKGSQEWTEAYAFSCSGTYRLYCLENVEE